MQLCKQSLSNFKLIKLTQSHFVQLFIGFSSHNFGGGVVLTRPCDNFLRVKATVSALTANDYSRLRLTVSSRRILPSGVSQPSETSCACVNSSGQSPPPSSSSAHSLVDFFCKGGPLPKRNAVSVHSALPRKPCSCTPHPKLPPAAARDTFRQPCTPTYTLG